jgi:predicted O-linked N-acetylglucosamine transferase (SPINDLY family)
MNDTLKQLQAAVVALFAEAGRLAASGDALGAVRTYQQWLAQNGASPLAHAVLFNLGVLQSELGELAAAEQCYRQALERHADFLQARFNLGSNLEKQRRNDEALDSWRHLLALPDDCVDEQRSLLLLALNNSGRLLETLKRYPEAEAVLERSLRIDPEQPHVIHHWAHLRQKQCSWPVLAELPGLPPERSLEAVSALSMLDISDDPALQLAAAQRYVEERTLPDLEPLANPAGYGHRKLRIGYLSSDFSLHPVSMLTVEMIELHDREQFEVYGFCWSPNDGSALRQRVLDALDVYVPIGALSDEEAARRIREAEIDILIDLQGLTAGARINILARRPAPLQVAYLGFPGTSGMPYIDYVLCDRYVLPEAALPYFTEKPLYLPEVFQVCDRQRPVGPTPTRASCGLPDDGFVFCAFNNNHKYTPEVFAAWLNILEQVPSGVLWLLADNPSVRPNLLALCAERGIAAERLIFAPRALPPDYLARYRIADLFLDCFPFNGGTTANDALWMGLPLLTCPGRSFASRMAGSLLHSLGLDELVAADFAEYERLAVELARQPERLAAIRARLTAGRDSAALFDTPSQVRKIEQLLREAAKSVMVPAGSELPLPGLAAASPESVMNFASRASAGVNDPARFSALMSEATELVTPGYYLGDNLFTWGRNNSPLDDEAFRNAWSENRLTPSDHTAPWGRYMLACAAFHCVHLAGDFVACGVGMGSAIKTLLDYIGGPAFPKTFWGYDSFESTVGGPEGEELFQQVRARFADYPQVRLIKGPLPQALAGDSPQQIAYLHLDLSSAEQEFGALMMLFERVVPGGTIVLEHYESAAGYRTQKLRADQWLDERGYRVFPLPTGQGLLLKR